MKRSIAILTLAFTVSACDKKKDDAVKTPNESVGALATKHKAPKAISDFATQCEGGDARACMHAGAWFFDQAQTLVRSDKDAAKSVASAAKTAYAKACELYEDGAKLKNQACRLSESIRE